MVALRQVIHHNIGILKANFNHVLHGLLKQYWILTSTLIKRTMVLLKTRITKHNKTIYPDNMITRTYSHHYRKRKSI